MSSQRNIERSAPPAAVPASDRAPVADEAAHGGWIAAGTPEFRYVSWMLCAGGITTFALLYLVQPLLPILATDFAVSPATSSLALSASTETLSFALLFSGILSDRIGRKAVMTASLLSAALLTLLVAAASSWHWLLLARVLLGISLSGVPAVGIAYLAEEMQPRAFGLAVGLFISGGVVGGMGGRLLIGLMADFMPWRVAMAIIGACALGASLAVWRLLPASRNFHGRRTALGLPQAFRTHLSNPTLVLLFAEAFLLMGGFVNVFNYITFRLAAPPFSLSQAFVGAIFAVYVTGMFSSAWGGSLAARRGRAEVFWPMILISAAGLALTLPDSLPMVVLGAAVFAFGFFAAHSVASGWVSQTAATNKALAASLYLFFYYQGSSITGVSGGFFWSAFGWPGVVGLTGAMSAAAIVIALALRLQRPAGSAARDYSLIRREAACAWRQD
jgi:YNFM family putative membrane transporter